jgi:hypothetical protein
MTSKQKLKEVSEPYGHLGEAILPFQAHGDSSAHFLRQQHLGVHVPYLPLFIGK